MSTRMQKSEWFKFTWGSVILLWRPQFDTSSEHSQATGKQEKQVLETR